MSQKSVRAIVDRLELPIPYLRSLIEQYNIPQIEDRKIEDWQRLERLLVDPPDLDVNGWTYFKVYNTVVRLLNQKGYRCLIQPPGLESRWVERSLCHHPYSEVAGGAKRWRIVT